jgi:polysaccharide biosynthesis/export protein
MSNLRGQTYARLHFLTLSPRQVLRCRLTTSHCKVFSKEKADKIMRIIIVNNVTLTLTRKIFAFRSNLTSLNAVRVGFGCDFQSDLLGAVMQRHLTHLKFATLNALLVVATPFATAQAPAQSVTLPAGQPATQPVNAAALAAPSDYRIGTHDLLEIQVFGVDTLNRSVRVNAKGNITLPLVGAVEVGGKTSQEAEELITRRLAEKYLQDPQVSVFIKEFTSQRVTVEGAVKKPGIYPLAGQTTLLRALALAGGQDSLSDMTEVMVFRNSATTGKRQSASFDVEKIRKGDLEDPTLVNDDVVVVKRSAVRVGFKDSVFRDIIDMVNPFAR